MKSFKEGFSRLTFRHTLVQFHMYMYIYIPRLTWELPDFDRAVLTTEGRLRYF